MFWTGLIKIQKIKQTLQGFRLYQTKGQEKRREFVKRVDEDIRPSPTNVCNFPRYRCKCAPGCMSKQADFMSQLTFHLPSLPSRLSRVLRRSLVVQASFFGAFSCQDSKHPCSMLGLAKPQQLTTNCISSVFLLEFETPVFYTALVLIMITFSIPRSKRRILQLFPQSIITLCFKHTPAFRAEFVGVFLKPYKK